MERRALFRSRMKTLRPWLALVLVACADGAAPESAARTRPPDLPRPRSEVERLEPDPPPSVDVEGVLATDLDEPVVGRSVVIVDAHGKRFDTKSKEGGVFRVAGVAPPYDLAIAQAPSGDVRVPTVLFDVSRVDPYVELFERSGPVGRPPRQTFALAVAAPPCTSGRCFVAASSSSRHGTGFQSTSYEGTCAPIVLSLEHEWTAPFVPGGERVDVHVLTMDGERKTFAYAHAADLEASAGATTDLGTLEPHAVETTGPVTFRVSPATLPNTWSRTLGVTVDLPSGASFPIFQGESTSSSLVLPVLPGATVNASAWALEPPLPESSSTYAASHARSGARAITSAAIEVEPAAPPTPVRPQRDGTMSRHGSGFAWSSPGPALSTVTVIDTTRDVVRLRAVLGGDEIPMERLVTLGLARFEPGPHVISIETIDARGIDDATSPDPVVRRRRFDRDVAARATYQRHPFTMTP